MCLAHVVGGEDRVKLWDFVGWNFGECALDIFAAALKAIDKAEHTGDGHAGVACGFDGSNRGTARGAHVVDDDEGAPGCRKPSMRRPVP